MFSYDVAAPVHVGIQETLYLRAEQPSLDTPSLTYILHQSQKPGLLRMMEPQSLVFSFINPVSQALLRKVKAR